MDELTAAKMRILQVIRMEKQEGNPQTVLMLREALELIDRQIEKAA